MTGSGTRKRKRLPLAALILAGVSVAGVAHANQPETTPPGAQSPAALQAAYANKLRLVGVLLAQSPAVRRIPDSGNSAARRKLAEAQSLHAGAEGEAAAGNLESAVAMLDRALLEIVGAARLVPDPAQQVAQERARYLSLAESTRAFQSLYDGLAARMAERRVRANAPAYDSAQAGAALAQAETLARGERYDEAGKLLLRAYADVVGALNGLLMAQTIVYDQKFASVADEFRHELARSRSYEDLVPLAVAQLGPTRETAGLADRYVQQGRGLREQAQRQADGGDHGAALKTLQEATGHLQRALRIVGVIVPQMPER